VSIDDRSTVEGLELIGAHLADGDGLVLAHLDINSDEYELVVVSKKDATALVALSKKARYGEVELFLGANLARYERERLARDTKANALEAKDPNRQQQFIHPDGRVLVRGGKAWSVGPEKYYALEIMKRPLGVENDFTPPTCVQTIARAPEEIVALRASTVASCTKAGFVEVVRKTYVEKDEAAKHARKKPTTKT